MRATHDEPDERRARLDHGRATFHITDGLDPGDPALLSTLRGWDWVARSLLSRGAVGAPTRTKLEDSRRIVGELARVLAGEEPGEGTDAERHVFAAVAGGQVQAVAALFPCPRAVFVELVATAPWNLLGPGDPPDARAIRGAGSALLSHAERWSRRTGRGGRVSLQAENPRALGIYERMGFQKMRPSDAPLALVPEGDHGWSASILRLAQGRAGPEEARSPWMLLDPARRASAAVPLAHRYVAGRPFTH
jgi:GNAT superfamily N-acetyltransferase